MLTLNCRQFSKDKCSVSLDNLLDSIEYNSDNVYLRLDNDLDSRGVLKRKNAIRRVNASTWETAEDLNDSETTKYSRHGRVKLIRRNAFRRSAERDSLNSGFLHCNDLELDLDLNEIVSRKKFKSDFEGETGAVKMSRSCEDVLSTLDECKPRSTAPSFASLKDVESKMEDLGPCLIRDTDEGMRNVMVEWLIGITDRMSVDQDVLFFSVSIMDRFLKSETIESDFVVSLPLLASSCLSLACKNRPKHVRTNHLEMFQKTGFTLNFRQVLDTEETIRNRVNGPLCRALSQPVHFLARYCRASLLSVERNYLANFVLELSLFSPVVLSNSAPLVAASALFVAQNLNLDCNATSKSLYYSEHSDNDILRVVKLIVSIMLDSDKLNNGTLYDKYSKEERAFVSLSDQVKPEAIQFLRDQIFPGEETD